MGVCSEAARSVFLREVIITFHTVSLGLKISSFDRNAGLQRLVNTILDKKEEANSFSIFTIGGSIM